MYTVGKWDWLWLWKSKPIFCCHERISYQVNKRYACLFYPYNNTKQGIQYTYKILSTCILVRKYINWLTVRQDKNTNDLFYITFPYTKHSTTDEYMYSNMYLHNYSITTYSLIIIILLHVSHNRTIIVRVIIDLCIFLEFSNWSCQ